MQGVIASYMNLDEWTQSLTKGEKKKVRELQVLRDDAVTMQKALESGDGQDSAPSWGLRPAPRRSRRIRDASAGSCVSCQSGKLGQQPRGALRARGVRRDMRP